MRPIMMLLLASIYATQSCATKDEDAEEVAISRRVSVCAQLTNGASYQPEHSAADFELGRMVIGGTAIEVYIGRQPPFRGDVWPVGTEESSRFQIVGRESFDGIEKLLLGQKPENWHGPLFVMFSAPELSRVMGKLLERDFVKGCDPESEDGRGQTAIGESARRL